jgi:ATP-binding cassette subfamily B protein
MFYLASYAFINVAFTLENLCFRYPDSNREILKNISLRLGPGMTGIAGPTASGKSTLCRVLARLYPVEDGMLYLGAVDANQVAVQHLQGLIGYVAQEPFLFSSTIGDNISFGRPGVAQEEIEQAARMAAIHDEISLLPSGYDSLLGERGVNLSGGQRQRIGLARALLCNRPILIVDDGLSAVDVETEQRILENLSAWLAGKTVLWVSQRIKQLSRADRVVVLEKGSVTGIGSLEQLVKENRFLSRIALRQSLQNNRLETAPE